MDIDKNVFSDMFDPNFVIPFRSIADIAEEPTADHEFPRNPAKLVADENEGTFWDAGNPFPIANLTIQFRKRERISIVRIKTWFPRLILPTYKIDARDTVGSDWIYDVGHKTTEVFAPNPLFPQTIDIYLDTPGDFQTLRINCKYLPVINEIYIA